MNEIKNAVCITLKLKVEEIKNNPEWIIIKKNPSIK